ncbi:MAG: DUF177 domain-containing protein [Deltaproteobacteria bacterium]|nr:DUF177 domain-containing protein [Deltaproteobacteria bacterium]
MRIKVDDIPEGGLSLVVSENGKDLERLTRGLDFSIPSGVEARLNITSSDGTVYVAGDIKAGVVLSCGRCLREFERPVDASFTVFFVRGKESEREIELKGSDMEVNFLDRDELDTDDIILGQIALDMDIQRLCSADCRGLCPKCGADLNAGPCGCPANENINPRFMALKDFKGKLD